MNIKMLNFISNQINANFKMKMLFHIHMTDKKSIKQ